MILTGDSTMQHSLRAHLQIVIWKHLNTSVLNPIGRGWELDFDDKLRPKMITSSIAPKNLLKGICCSCKEGERQCETLKCSCMKAGKLCISPCSHYSGHCNNGSLATEIEDLSDDESN